MLSDKPIRGLKASRKRTPHLKSRTGCTRCKAKRAKCDEQKPECQRCLGSGLPCPGYTLNIRWSSKHQKKQSIQQRAPGPFENKSPIPSNIELGPENSPPMNTFNESAMPSLDIGNSVFVDFNAQDGWSGDVLSQINDFGTLPLDPFWVLTDMSATQITQSRVYSPHAVDESSQCNEQTPPGVRAVHDTTSTLCSYFLTNVIGLYCTYDSEKNMMRVLVEQYWQSSETLYHTIQSMAAVCLSSDFPHLATLASTEREKALNCLKEAPMVSKYRNLDNLLAICLLGHTASWHRPHELAEDQFSKAREMQAQLIKHSDTRESHFEFFEAGLDYWQMLLAFVTGDESNEGQRARDNILRQAGPLANCNPEISHPFYGVSRAVIRALTGVGSLIFRYRSRMVDVRWITLEDTEIFRRALCDARSLEEILVSHKSNFEDTGDPLSTCAQLQKMTVAYQCIGLLQLYRVFPDLLARRYQPWDPSKIFLRESSTKQPDRQDIDDWLTKLALHIIDVVRQTSFESHTRCIQPFLFVATSSELRLGTGAINQNFNAVPDHRMIEVTEARKFINMRLSAYSHILPLRKVQKMLDLVRIVFSLLDSGDDDVYWMDILRKNGLETMMG